MASKSAERRRRVPSVCANAPPEPLSRGDEDQEPELEGRAREDVAGSGVDTQHALPHSPPTQRRPLQPPPAHRRKIPLCAADPAARLDQNGRGGLEARASRHAHASETSGGGAPGRPWAALS